MNDGCLMGCRPAIGVHRICCPNAGVVTHRESREQSESLSPDRVALQEAERALRESQRLVVALQHARRMDQHLFCDALEDALGIPRSKRGWEEVVADVAALAAAAAPSGPRVTHGRHCPCTACKREDWTRITGACGMHGPACPAVYAPIPNAASSGEPPSEQEQETGDEQSSSCEGSGGEPHVSRAKKAGDKITCLKCKGESSGRFTT